MFCFANFLAPTSLDFSVFFVSDYTLPIWSGTAATVFIRYGLSLFELSFLAKDLAESKSFFIDGRRNELSLKSFRLECIIDSPFCDDVKSWFRVPRFFTKSNRGLFSNCSLVINDTDVFFELLFERKKILDCLLCYRLDYAYSALLLSWCRSVLLEMRVRVAPADLFVLPPLKNSL